VREFLCVGAGVVGDDLARAEESPFVNQEAFEADRAAVESAISRTLNWAAITERDVPVCAFLLKIR